jgi:hypothetical protein
MLDAEHSKTLVRALLESSDQKWRVLNKEVAPGDRDKRIRILSRSRSPHSALCFRFISRARKQKNRKAIGLPVPSCCEIN